MSQRVLLTTASLTAVLSVMTAAPALAGGPTFNQSVEVQGSLCVGNDCPNAPAYGFDTIRLQENNLRIHFDDTSVAAAFPRNDWGFQANDSANGGDEYLAILDRTANRQVFRVDAGARSNALYVDSAGDVGVGTSTPVVEMHLVRGDTPTLRLEQDGSSGFTPQTFDVAGNEVGFFVRDATFGSTLPFRILVSAPSASLLIDGDGDVGVGAGTNPAEALHVERSDGSAQVLVEENGADGSSTLLRLTSNARPIFEFENGSVASDEGLWRASSANNGDFEINNVGISGATPVEFDLANDGDLTIAGTLTENSDKNAKMAIVPVDNSEILAKVMDLPVSHWTYKHDADEGIRHIGPMAQDFYALFGTGAGETGISTLDSSGVALAAIQALNDDLRDRDAQIQEMAGQIARLTQMVTDLQAAAD